VKNIGRGTTMLKKNGCRVDWESRTAKIPPDLVEENNQA
jgi:hypothetical protein